jgi:hypothetical protein
MRAKRHVLDPREFNGRVRRLALRSPPSVQCLRHYKIFAAAAGPPSNGAGRTVGFPDGTIVPALGQGSWHLAQGRHAEAVEAGALRAGLSPGMTLIDTSDN